MAETKLRSAADSELAAIGAILHALNGLDGESIQRVLDYVFSRLSIAFPTHIKTTSVPSMSQSIPSSMDVPHRSNRPSIRDLKDEKQPESSNQMAALVAFYLSEVVADDEKKDTLNTADLEKYFKQAGFKLPKSLAQTLPNATAAGYFDSVGNGMYKLNPVGYNLVAHGLPRGHAQSSNRRRKPSPKLKQRKRKS
jgi:hypothetical protein